MHQLGDGSQPSNENRSLLEKPCVAPISPRLQLLKIDARTCFDSRWRGLGSMRSTSCNQIRRLAIRSNACGAAMSPSKENPREHSSTWKKKAKFTRLKCRGAVSICVTTPIISPGPTNTWALHLPIPLPRGAPHGCPCGPPWPLATCPRHLCHLCLTWAMCGPATWPQCHVASALLPRTTSAPRSCDK